jgi:hypothetical protein
MFEYLCEAVDAVLRHFPSVGPDAPCMALKVTMSVRSRVTDSDKIEPIGRQAVIWVLVDRNLRIVGDEAARFVADVGIQLDREKKPEIEEGRMVACHFGDPDQEFGYQAVLHCRVVDPADYRTVPTPKLNRSKPFGLDWDEDTRAVRRMVGNQVEHANFGNNNIPFQIFLYLARHIDRHCSAKELSDHPWEWVRREDHPDINTIYKHIKFIKDKINDLGLKVVNVKKSGYKLAE